MRKLIVVCCVLAISCIGTSEGRRLRRQNSAVDRAPSVPAIPPPTQQSPPPPPPPSVQPQSSNPPLLPVQPAAVPPAAPPSAAIVNPAAPQVGQLPQQQQQQPILAQQPLIPQQPLSLAAQLPLERQPNELVSAGRFPGAIPAESIIPSESASSFLLQLPQQQQQQPELHQQPDWRRPFAPKGSFAPGFEAKPLPVDLSLGAQPQVQFIGAEQQQQQDPRLQVPGSEEQAQLLLQQQFQQQQQQQQQQLNLAVIKSGDQQQSKSKLLSVPRPPPVQVPQQAIEDEELRDRIHQANVLRNNAGRDREAFLARINVTGNQAAADAFVRQLKNLTEFQEKQPFATKELLAALINAEIQVAVDNWVINEEIAGELAATFNIPRDSVGSSIVLTPADIDEMHFSGNNPTAAKKFHVQLMELLWRKVDQQYRITTDLLGTMSDALLELLVGNGLVKEKYAVDIASYFYRASNRRIKLF